MSLVVHHDHVNEAIGSLESFTQRKDGMEIKAENASILVLVYGPGIIRIRVSKQGFEYEDNPYSVVARPMNDGFEVGEDGQEIHLITSRIQLKITKSPVRFTFLTLDGQVLNADDPSFGTSWIGEEATTYKVLQDGERFIGLGEKTGGLDRRGKAFTNWNYDYFAYPIDADPLYMSVPFFIGLHHNLAYGIFFDNTYKTLFNFGASNKRFSYFASEGPNADYYFIHNASVAGIIEAYTHLTGRAPLPPKWSLGYQQCRYSYYPDTEVLRIARTFREKQIPADVIYLDIHYMDAYKVFTWHPERFPDPGSLVGQLEELGFKVVVIVDPGIKIEEGYTYYEEGKEQDLFAKFPDGVPYEAQVWPGWCHFPDFTKPEARQWWGKAYSTYTDHGIEGFWNDMNEPATWGNKIPDLVMFHFDGQGATHRKAHNIYGMQMARSTYEGVRKLMGNKRPFVLSRSGFAGVQRYAAIWTGDNVATDDHMLAGIRLLNSMGLSGISCAGYDVGGFSGEASRQLYARWVALGAFSPFYRGHSMINSRDAEPWTFGEEVEEIARNFINLRYQLLPYIYSVFYKASQTGMPVQRSLAIECPHDHRTFKDGYENQYLFGPDLLIAPLASNLKLEKVFLPPGLWYDFYRDTVHQGNSEILIEVHMDEVPCFVRGGAFIPMQETVQSTKEQPEPVLNLHFYHGDEDHSFTYYEDDGSTYDYTEGDFYQRIFEYKAGERAIHLDKVKGQYQPFFSRIRLYCHGFEAHEVLINGKMIQVEIQDHRFVRPVSNYDPWEYKADLSKIIKGLKYIEFPVSDDEIVINW